MIRASLVIPTRDRKEDLRRALSSARAQTVALEVLVMDDGSVDGTVEMVRSVFPGVQLHQLGQDRGPTFQRTRGTALAKGEIVFSIDDDAAFASQHTAEQTLREFDHPRVGAVCIPFINVRQDRYVHQRAPDDRDIWVTSAYVGAARAVRRDVFLGVGGYRTSLVIYGEESDVCARMLNAGYVTRLGLADPMHHHESPRRDRPRQFRLSARNQVLFGWHNAPGLSLPAHVGMTSINLMKYGFRRRHPIWTLEGIAWGFLSVPGVWGERAALSPEVYRLFRRLRTAGPLKLAEVEARLPSRVAFPATPAVAPEPAASGG